ncbi:MAG TPA: hypothetical protein VFO11_00755 [Candidatus Polarisedimenticolaceae bacterium]|nr:hypothetical protein [Candidatus Polarisedimenticolaceae bacterium]
MRVTGLVLCICASSSLAHSAQEIADGSLARMPIKEVTVFKDGHAFVVHEGRLPTDPSGRVVLDRLPVPVLGTFWPYSAEAGVRLASVTASRRRVRGERTAIDVRGLLQANPGAAVEIVDLDGKTLSGRVLSLPSRPVEELEGEGPAEKDVVPVQGGMVLLDTGQGVLALPVERVRSVTFKDRPSAKYASDSFRDLLTLSFAPGAGSRREVDVGMAYVQRGLRWIPSYRVTIDGRGKAHVQLQATLVNELADLEDVTANLVIGVPSFAFKEMVDPMALQETVAQLGVYFDSASASGNALSNAIMAQTREYQRLRDFQAPPAVPEVVDSEKEEDLFVFTVKGVTLKKGERMVLPVLEHDLAYRDIYVLELPFAPPMELRGNVNEAQQREVARLLGAPRFTHVLRLANTGREPLTTAPALISVGERVLGQGLMKYTASGAQSDLALTTAVDLTVSKQDKEAGRVPSALLVNGSSYQRVDLKGEIAIQNHRDEAVDIEVKRSVLGHADTAGQGGTVEMVNAYESGEAVALPPWWGWYGWPGWWGSVNGIGQFTWKSRIEAGKSVALTYSWHYFWQ